jgi:hypothetical protein
VVALTRELIIAAQRGGSASTYSPNPPLYG